MYLDTAKLDGCSIAIAGLTRLFSATQPFMGLCGPADAGVLIIHPACGTERAGRMNIEFGHLCEGAVLTKEIMLTLVMVVAESPFVSVG